MDDRKVLLLSPSHHLLKSLGSCLIGDHGFLSAITFARPTKFPHHPKTVVYAMRICRVRSDKAAISRLDHCLVRELTVTVGKRRDATASDINLVRLIAVVIAFAQDAAFEQEHNE